MRHASSRSLPNKFIVIITMRTINSVKSSFFVLYLILPSLVCFHCGGRSTTQTIAVVQPTPVSNPFGTLPAVPQMSIGRVGTSPSIQYGISNLPVSVIAY